MKFFIAFSAIIAVTYCKPSVVAPVVAPLVAVSAPVQSQYHAQDGLGQYVYGYSNQLSAKNEAKSLDGTTVGTYAYIDPNGKVQTVQYSADSVSGFRAVASNLPVAPSLPTIPVVAPLAPVEDTPEVAEARAKHLAEFEEIKKSFEASALKNSAPIIEVKSSVDKELTPAVVAKSKPESTIKAKSSDSIISTTSGILSPSIISPAITAPFFTASAVALRTSIPTTQFLSHPALHGYSFGINTINGAYISHQPAILAYSSPLLSAPVVQLQATQPAPAASWETNSSEVVIEAKKSEEPKETEKTKDGSSQ